MKNFASKKNIKNYILALKLLDTFSMTFGKSLEDIKF